MTANEQKAAAKAFVKAWKDKGYEKGKAHQLNDKAVMEVYGFPIKNFTESDYVTKLMKMYQELAK